MRIKAASCKQLAAFLVLDAAFLVLDKEWIRKRRYFVKSEATTGLEPLLLVLSA